MSAGNVPVRTGPANAPKTPPGRGPKPSSPFGKPGADDDFVIDLTGVDLTGGYVGVGRWLGYVSNIEKTQSKAGNPMIVWSVTVYEGEYQGKSMKLYTALTPDALWKLGEVMDAIGFAMTDDKRFPYGDLKAAGLRTLVIMDVIEDEYNGNARNSLNSLFPPNEAGYEPGSKIPDPSSPRR